MPLREGLSAGTRSSSVGCTRTALARSIWQRSSIYSTARRAASFQSRVGSSGTHANPLYLYEYLTSAGHYSPELTNMGQGREPMRHVVRMGPAVATIEPVVRVELERIEALELLGITLGHLNAAEARVELSPRVPLLMAIRDKLALALREEP